MRFHVAHHGFVALAAAVIVGCSSDRATAPNVHVRELKGPSAALIDLTDTPVLYNQTKITINEDAFGEAGNTSYLADDFIVPADTVWTVANVGIIGLLLSNNPLTFSIRQDAGGQPGALVPNSNVSLQPSAVSNIGLPSFNNYLFTLPTAIRLPAGKYWFAILTRSAEDGYFRAWWMIHNGVVNSLALGSEDGGATWQARTTDYGFAVFGTTTLTQTITFAPLPLTAAVGSTATLSATASSGLTVSFTASPASVCTVSGTTLNFVGTGSCVVTAMQPGNLTYEPAEMVIKNVLVGKASQTISFPSITPNPATVAGSATLGATASSGLVVSYSSLTTNVCTVSGTTVSYVNVGTCTLSANQAGNVAYSAAAPMTKSVKVDYRYDGFLGSVKNGDVLNVAKAGQVIPLQWRLTDASGAPIVTLSSAKITVTDLNCALGATGDQVAEQAAGASGLQNLGDGYYQLNWKAPANYARSCKTLHLDLGEGSGTRTASFAFTK